MEAIFKLTIDSGTFEADIVKAKRAIEELKKEKLLYDEKVKLGLQLTEEESTAQNKLAVAIKAHQTQLNSLNKITQLNIEANLAQKGSIDQITKQYKAAELQLKAMGGTVERGTDGILKLTGVNKENEQATYELFQTMKQFDAQLGKNNLNVGNYGSVLQKLKQQILDLDQQRSIANDPAEVMRLTTEIRKLTLQQDQYLGKVDELGNRVAKNDIKDGFMDASGALGALSSGMFLLTMGMDENSKSGELMRKVMIGLTVAQTALSIAQSKADIVQTAALVKTKALAAAQWLYNNAVQAFTLVGAAAFIIALTRIISSTKKQNDEQEKAIQQMKTWDEMSQALLEREIAKQEELVDIFIRSSDVKKTIALQESLGIDQSKEKAKLLSDEIESFKAIIAANEKRAIANKQFGAFEKVLNKDVIDGLKLLIYNRQIELNQIITRAEKSASNVSYLAEESYKTRELASSVSLLTAVERERLDQQIKSQFLDNPNVQDAFQRLIGIDDATFQQVWDNIGQTTSEQEIILQGVERAQNNLTDAAQRTNDTYDETLNKIKRNENAMMEFSEIFGAAYAGVLTKGLDSQKDFYKQSLLMFVEYLEKVMMGYLAETLFKELATKGFGGLITGAVIGGLIKGAFAAAKSQISGFAEGGLVLPEHGVPIQRDNGDNRLATIKTGEVIMNETQQQRLKAAAGSDIFKKLGIPGFATGGVMDGGFAFRQATARTNDNLEIRQAVMDAVRSMPPNTLYISDLERMQRDRGRALNIVSLDK